MKNKFTATVLVGISLSLLLDSASMTKIIDDKVSTTVSFIVLILASINLVYHWLNRGVYDTYVYENEYGDLMYTVGNLFIFYDKCDRDGVESEPYTDKALQAYLDNGFYKVKKRLGGLPTR